MSPVLTADTAAGYIWDCIISVDKTWLEAKEEKLLNIDNIGMNHNFLWLIM